jgi:hypothetical protein
MFNQMSLMKYVYVFYLHTILLKLFAMFMIIMMGIIIFEICYLTQINCKTK